MRRRASRLVAALVLITACTAHGADLESLLETELPAINITALKHAAGECAVGLSCGAAAAWILRRAQSVLTNVAFLGGIGTIAALHLHWVSLDQVRAVAATLTRFVYSRLFALWLKADLDDDGDVTIDDAQVAYNRVLPVARRHAALTSGAVGGFLTAYSTLR